MSSFPIVQRTSVVSATGSADVVLTFASTPTAGHAVFVPIIMTATLGTEAVTVSDNQGNTYTVTHAANNNNARAALAYAYNIVSSGTFTVTVHPTGTSQGTEAEAWQISGFGTVDPLVGSATNTGLSTTASATTGATGVSPVLVIGVMALRRVNFDITSITIGAVSPAFTEEFEQLASGAGALGGEADQREVSSTGTEAASWSISASGTNVNWSCIVQAFNGTPPNPLARMTQFSRETLEFDTDRKVRLTQFAREVLYPFTCSGSVPAGPGTTVRGASRGIYVPTRGLAGAEGGGGGVGFNDLTNRIIPLKGGVGLGRAIYVPPNPEGNPEDNQ